MQDIIIKSITKESNEICNSTTELQVGFEVRNELMQNIKSYDSFLKALTSNYLMTNYNLDLKTVDSLIKNNYPEFFI